MSVTPKRNARDRISLPWSEGKVSGSGGRRRGPLDLGEPATPKTPQSTVKSSRHGLWGSFNGTIVESYSEAGSIGSIIVGTPGVIPMPSCSSHNAPARILKRALQYPIPDKFKQAMPIRKEEPAKDDFLTPNSKLKPIEKKNFYGSKVESSPETSPKHKSDDDDDDEEVMETNDKDENKLVAIKSPKVEEPKKTKSLKKSTKKPVLRRVASSGKIIKRNKLMIRKKFGINKGVQHAIRKPVVKKVKRKTISPEKKEAEIARQKKREEKEEREREKQITKEEKEREKELQLGARVEKILAAKSPSMFKQAPKKSGKISVAQSSPNVIYEIRNGFPVFRLRRSPRKQTPTSPIKSPYSCTVGKTPAKLFTPSGSSDYLSGSPVSVGKRRGPALPSPVKFHAIADDDNNETGKTVSNLIASLGDDNDDEDAEMAAENEHAVFVTDDEIEKLASQTVVELESLDHEDFLANDENLDIPPAIETTPSKRRTSPRKKSPTKTMTTMTTNSPFNVVKPKENVTDTIKNILANLPPPTEEEIRAKRTPKSGPLVEIGNSPTKNGSPTKLFPIFDKGSTAPTVGTPTSSRKHPAKRNFLASTVNDDGKSGLKQAVIDAGQKRIGAEYCLLCDFIYTVGDADEEKLHMEKHNHATGIIKYTAWKNERVVREFEDGKIILIRPGDSKRHWAKVESVLEVVDRTLGITGRGGIRQPEQSKVFMFISDGHVAGFLLAETIDKTDHVSLAILDEKNVRVLQDINPEKAKNILVGISRIWVEPSFQRKGLATRMADAMRAEFIPGKHLKVSEFAFTHTTPNGTDFASKYVKQPEFLTYTSAIEGVGN